MSEHPLPDMQTLKAALDRLKSLSAAGKPFFLAVGFMKPHLPFVFPKSFLDLYPPETIELPKNPFAPDRMPEVSSDFHTSFWLFYETMQFQLLFLRPKTSSLGLDSFL